LFQHHDLVFVLLVRLVELAIVAQVLAIVFDGAQSLTQARGRVLELIDSVLIYNKDYLNLRNLPIFEFEFFLQL
jgi:ABC-type phosphate/phosphonate transport system permease subunit